jgi:hypothetical protein
MRKSTLQCFVCKSLMASVGVSLAALSCKPGTRAPTFAAPYDSVPPDTLLAYISTLQFDTTEWAGDAQRLMVGTCPASCSHGPLVRIEPEKRAHRNKASSLQGNQGRIIARMINKTATDSYPKYNLAPADTVYWAVRQVGSYTKYTDSGTSVYISTRGLRGTHPTPFEYDSALVEKHPSSYYAKQALAHWVWSDFDEQKWGVCNKDGCCR